MIMVPLKIKQFNHASAYGEMQIWPSTPEWIVDALASIIDGLQDMRDDSALCHAIANHMDFADLVARVAAVKHLRDKIERSEINLTATERATLDRLAGDPCDWVRNEAKCALDDLANPLPDQVAAHDGAEDFEPELRAFEARGVTVEDHARLNYIRANSTGGIRNQAGALLVKLANLPGVAK